jgi:hypothetical protein
MKPMSRTPSCRRAACLAGALVITLVGACSGDDDEAVPTPAPTTAAVTAGSSSATVPVTTAPVTTAPASPAPTSAGTAAGTSPATAAPTAPPTTAAPTAPPSTEPLSVQELVLSGDGLGSAVFGAEADGVIDYVTSILGGNTADTGWVPPDTFAVCDGTIARRVDWGALSLLFTDLSPIANGRRHFIGYEYGRVGQIGDEPVGLRTPGGVTLGSRVVDLLAEFPDAAVNEGDPQVGIPDNFYVSNVFYGLLTGTTAEDYVTVLFGGSGCGE